MRALPEQSVGGERVLFGLDQPHKDRIARGREFYHLAFPFGAADRVVVVRLQQGLHVVEPREVGALCLEVLVRRANAAQLN